MYHKYDKSNWKVRKALYETYNHKCACCGDTILPKNMHIDHIYAEKNQIPIDEDFISYINKLFSNGFSINSLENYRPTCQNCNLSKNNRNFNQLVTLQSILDKAYGLGPNVDTLIKSYTDSMSFDDYEPDYLYWKKIDFKNQKNISDAIYGSRLDECHVISCPDLGQVDEIANRLKNVDYVVISSEPGCGKSLTIHKCAYEYYKQGWTIYKFNHMSFDGDIYIPPLINTDKELLIVDDAQKLLEYKILNLVNQSNINCKILLAFTDTASSIDIFREPIRITKKDAVNNMYTFYLKNKKDILPIVMNINKDIGIDSMSLSYERVLEECKKQDKPWMFNYILRGGWKNETANYQSVYNINHISFLIASIAFNQIVQLDDCSNINHINIFYNKYKIKWNEQHLKILFKKKIIASMDDLRIIHLNSAINLLYAFYKYSTVEDKKIFVEYMNDYINNNKISYQGLLLLFNISFSYGDLKYYFFNDKVIDYCLNHILEITEDAEKGYSLYLLERIDIIDKKKVNDFIINNIRFFSLWLSYPTDKTVYCFSHFINGIINMHDDTIYQLGANVDFEQIFNCFKISDSDSFYFWCDLFNRLVFSLKNEEWFEKFTNELYVITKNMNNVPIISYICGLAKLIHFDEKYINLIHIRKNEIKDSFLYDFNESLDLFRGDNPLVLFGYSSFGHISISENSRNIANEILDMIPIDHFINYISNSEPRDWLTIEAVGQILNEYKRIEYKLVVDALDFNKLSISSHDLWENSSHDLIYLIIFMGMGNPKLTSDFIISNIYLIKKMDLIILSYIPDRIVSCIENGIYIEFFSGHNTGLLYEMLSYYLNNNMLNTILYLVKDDFIKKINNLCILDFDSSDFENFKSFNDVLLLIESKNKSFLSDSLFGIKYSQIHKIKQNMDKDSRLNNDIKGQFNIFVNLLSKYTNEDLFKLLYELDIN